MPYYYPYPYPIPHYAPIVPVYPNTTVTAVSAPIIHQMPGFNPLHGQDPGPAPPGIGNHVAGYVTDPARCANELIFWGLGLATIGPPVVRVAPIVAVPQPHTSNACANCRNQDANPTAANATASPPTPTPEPKPPATKPKSILKPTITPTPAPDPASSSSSPPSSPTKSKSKPKSKLEPPLDILTHANTNKNANHNPKSKC
ncbi:uncharacterized protein EAE98_005077 [Botrytis deweyae]|uniref:LITAF domain-containing protein n=1 Tax=Botrytis deweyae TaxID=2478750 RepID=A0ABQ7IQ69_9HELO|nr:uncharacterized protein EAE98_005077 [Botrytis deweyae]KAF7930677.1 hypothetical protein EAE98_005077 [Botrytis deweyae]